MSVQSRPQQTKKKYIESHKYMDILCFCCTYLPSDQGWEALIIRTDIFFKHFPVFTVPQVLKSCTEFIEKHGVVDGIYRLSGIASNIQKLRYETHPLYLFSVCGLEYQVAAVSCG